MPRASWRDYVTLTKPRIMVLLLITGAGALIVGAGGLPSAGLALATLGGLALACGGASALNHVLDRDIDTHMKRTALRPVASGRVPPERALEFGLALSALSYVVLTSFVNVLAALLALVGNLFYVIVYTLAEALDAAEHRHRRRGRRRAAARRLRGRDRQPDPGRARALPDRLLLDAAALLGARAPDQARLRGRGNPDAARRARRAGDRPLDRPLLLRARRRDAPAGARPDARAVYLVSAPLLGLVFIGLALALQRQTTPCAPAASSATRSRTWRCSSWPWRSTR